MEDQNIPSSGPLDETNHNETNINNQPDEQTPEDFASRIDLKPLQDSVEQIKHEIAKFIVGQNEMIELLIISILIVEIKGFIFI